MKTNKTISEFRGKYAFLSNFYETEIHCWGFTYRNAEAAFQAMKNPSKANMFEGLDAKAAKNLGRSVELRDDWEEKKERFMYTVCLAKFTQNRKLGVMLLNTGNRELVEENSWGDAEWGVCNGIGKNLLGKILMRVRDVIQQDERAKYDAEVEKLHKLHSLQDYAMCNFENTEPIYHQLMHIADTAIAEKMNDIASLNGVNIIRQNKRKKYVFEVGRNRLGAAEVFINGELITTFLDEVVYVEEGDVIYTDIIKGKGSRIPDALFVKSLLYSHADDICHLSDKVKAVLDRDVPKEILEMQARNIELSKKNRREDS